MRDYISTILPRIQQYSKQLNDEANFVEIPWGFIDDDGDKVTYIFRRNNELLVSKKGEVATGHWEYLPVVQSMLIEYNGAKRMYNQGFLDKAVMVLRKDGTEEVFALGNIKAVPDLNIAGYLEKEVDSQKLSSAHKVKRPVFAGELLEGERIFFWGKKDEFHVYLSHGTEVTKSDKRTPLANGEYKLKNGDLMVVKDGIIQSYRPNQKELLAFVIISSFVVILLLIVILSK